jgi:GNAT superfamily N-acetyltransferase
VIDPNDASAVASREGDEGYAERLREVFAAHEGVVVGAFARVDGDGNGDEPTVLERRFPGLSLVQMGFDLLAGDGDVEGKTLIGYARAATDGSMVATVDEVVVDRKFRNRGVGRRLLSKLGDELRLREIYDVGARVPDVSRNFFRQCGFAPDPEDSVLMALPEEVAENTFARDFDPARRLKRGGEGVRERMLKEMEKKSPSRL